MKTVFENPCVRVSFFAGVSEYGGTYIVEFLNNYEWDEAEYLKLNPLVKGIFSIEDIPPEYIVTGCDVKSFRGANLEWIAMETQPRRGLWHYSAAA